ncbi:hypothetical protein DFJ74DRAFT_711356 [Hyaloraphidium curvatum]|nr:hypothetical protein DFJ74DRAFT_711356 [Hyaloraphidium curvatum]
MKVTLITLVPLALFAVLARPAAGVPTTGLGIEVAIGKPADQDAENVRFVEECGGCEPQE